MLSQGKRCTVGVEFYTFLVPTTFQSIHHNINTLCSKKVIHQAHVDILVNSQRIFKILSPAHSAENLL